MKKLLLISILVVFKIYASDADETPLIVNGVPQQFNALSDQEIGDMLAQLEKNKPQDFQVQLANLEAGLISRRAYNEESLNTCDRRKTRCMCGCGILAVLGLPLCCGCPIGDPVHITGLAFLNGGGLSTFCAFLLGRDHEQDVVQRNKEIEKLLQKIVELRTNSSADVQVHAD